MSNIYFTSTESISNKLNEYKNIQVLHVDKWRNSISLYRILLNDLLVAGHFASSIALAPNQWQSWLVQKVQRIVKSLKIYMEISSRSVQSIRSLLFFVLLFKWHSMCCMANNVSVAISFPTKWMRKKERTIHSIT